jgi:hypothetical protein
VSNSHWQKPFQRDEIQRIIEHGLLTGLWSVNDVIKGNQRNPVLPSLEFLETNPQFKDRHFRDLHAFYSRGADEHGAPLNPTPTP